jgi:succinyl-CoA synthetase beta subunit
MLGHHLMTQQTISEGLLVDKLYVTESVEHTDELYLAMTIDRARYCPAIILSKSGGVDIENIAKENPDLLHKYWFQLSSGITPELVSEISRDLGFTSVEENNMERILKNLFELFVKKDATLLEINPLARTATGEFVCLDAKFRFDDAAGKRQPELFALRDVSQEVDDEVAAEKFGLVYVRLDGNIGNVVNGAGLAMATNDAISLYGGRSANFLDAGGQATKETMQRAFEIILKDPRVNVILVNIYGGMWLARPVLDSNSFDCDAERNSRHHSM